MSAVATPFSSSTTAPSIPTEMLGRLSLSQYHEMIATGILTTRDRVELVYGCLVKKMTKNPAHTTATYLVAQALERLLPSGFLLRSQEPITMTDSEPEPDAALVRGAVREFSEEHPQPAQVLLVIEVADTSLAYDRSIKKRLYAENSIRVYWIVNLVARQLEVYTEPTGPNSQPDYRTRQDYSESDEIPVIIDGRELGRLTVRELLP